ncbi:MULTISPECIES: MCE family protein [Pseudonocardia]|uniref:MCE family protein n=1 Tax=Pseudonocardia TaxID=1847 RepID=UPI001E55F5E7|nr:MULTISPECIES: MCE family protein [Pseudonocardia]
MNRALDSVNRLSATLADRRGQIRTALNDISPGLRELEAQRAQLVGMLQALDRLSGVATDVVNRSRDDLIADLEALRPILRNLADSGQDLPNSLELLLTIPFTDAATDAVAGDYANLYVKLDLDLGSVLRNILNTRQSGLPLDPAQLAQLPPTAQLLTPLLGGEAPVAPPVPGVPQLPLLGPEQPAPAPAPEDGAATPAPPGSTQPPSPTPTPAPESSRGGLLGGLFGGGS